VVGWVEGRWGSYNSGQEGVVATDDGTEKLEDAVAGLPWCVPPSLPPPLPSSLLSHPPSLPPLLFLNRTPYPTAREEEEKGASGEALIGVAGEHVR